MDVFNSTTKSKNIRYPEELKLAIVNRYLTEDISQKSLGQEYRINIPRIMIWINRYREKVLSECFNNDINNTRMKKKNSNDKLEAQLKSYKEQLELANLKIEGLEILLSLASEDCGVDLLKKDAAKQLSHLRKDINK